MERFIMLVHDFHSRKVIVFLNYRVVLMVLRQSHIRGRYGLHDLLLEWWWRIIHI